MSEKLLIFELGKPSEEPLGVKKYRWAIWYTMHAVHQARRKPVFDEFNPLEHDRFI